MRSDKDREASAKQFLHICRAAAETYYWLLMWIVNVMVLRQVFVYVFVFFFALRASHLLVNREAVNVRERASAMWSVVDKRPPGVFLSLLSLPELCLSPSLSLLNFMQLDIGRQNVSAKTSSTAKVTAFSGFSCSVVRVTWAFTMTTQIFCSEWFHIFILIGWEWLSSPKKLTLIEREWPKLSVAFCVGTFGFLCSAPSVFMSIIKWTSSVKCEFMLR